MEKSSPLLTPNTRQLQLLHFCLFLGISLAALLANGLIISAVACGHLLPHAHVLLPDSNLALTDLGSICTTVPKAMHNSLWDTRNISYEGCAAQPCSTAGVVVAKVQDLALGLVKPPTVGFGPWIQPVQVPLQSPPTLQQIHTHTQLGVICKFADGGLSPLIQTINADTEIHAGWV
ncbi:hypothetical protein DUI87_19350 [Hirundo rustica rustica]|uniref:Uncharacterized protein n=1 Tax=Hirundo rustica rustica TaxID=333673 RepID=A0A3M0JSJ5_HIRRU|nr:hypothetical protein DUI87_19350 [Hirundo rustica rustica]